MSDDIGQHPVLLPDLATLRTVAEAATPKGEWRREEADCEDGLNFIAIMGGGVPGSAAEHCLGTVQSYGQSWDQCEADADFIATFDPPTILALLTHQEHLEAALRLICGDQCGNFTSGPGTCITARPNGRGHHYGAEAWCDACVAFEALNA